MNKINKTNDINQDFENFSFEELVPDSIQLSSQNRLWYLSFSLVIALTVFGNMMVVLAVLKNKKLQNTTNYFLTSLALADMLVAILVMPLSLWIELTGIFPFKKNICIIWISADILLCTCSIWHMCVMSMDRFFTIRFPLKYGRNKTRKLMLIKISLVWFISFSITIPLLVLGYENPASFFSVENSICALNHPQFKLYGSIFAFYIPLFIISITYSFTIVSLKKIIKKKEICIQQNKNDKKLSLFSNYFFNSDKSSRTNSIVNSENKRQHLINLPLISKKYFSDILTKKENFLHQQIIYSSNQFVEKKPHTFIKKSKSDSKLNKSPKNENKKVLVFRSERNSIDKKFEKPIEKPLDTMLTNYKENSVYKKCKNLCENPNFIDQKEIPILLLKFSNKLNELNPEFCDNRARKNSNVSFGSFSFFEYQNSYKDTPLRKMSQNLSLLSRISSKSKKKSTLSSADLILRSNSLFSSSTKQNIKMYNKHNNEEKALKVLMIIFLMFVLFWSPFFIVNIASVLCKDFLFLNNYQLILSITWLGYSSSMINPIIYTMFNKCFRKAFLNLLKCRTKIQNQFRRQNKLIHKKINHDSTKNSKIYV